MTTNQKISAAILNQINNGKTLEEAINTILGEGTFQQIANEIHEAANK